MIYNLAEHKIRFSNEEIKNSSDIFILVHDKGNIFLKDSLKSKDFFIKISADSLKNLNTNSLKFIGEATDIKTNKKILLAHCSPEILINLGFKFYNATQAIVTEQEARRLINANEVITEVDFHLFLTEVMSLHIPELEKIFTPSDNNFWQRIWAKQNNKSAYSSNIQREDSAIKKIKFFEEIGIKFKSDETVLESGCGYASVVSALSKYFSIKAYGVDFSHASITQAASAAKENGTEIDLQVADIRKTPFPDNTFDKIISLGVIEHLYNPLVSLSEIFRTLKPGGNLILMTPNKNSLCKVDRYYRQLRGTWPMGYQTEYTPEQLAGLTKTVGLNPVFQTSALRQVSEHDRINMRNVAKGDNIIQKIVPYWGFYSWVIAEKPSL